MTTHPPLEARPRTKPQPPPKPLDAEGQRLVLENMGLARRCGMRAYTLMRKHGDRVDREEAQAHSMLGLVIAASRYKPERGLLFTTFAAPYCFGYAYAAVAPNSEASLADAQLDGLEATEDGAEEPGVAAIDERDAFEHVCALAYRMRKDGMLSGNRWEPLVLLSQGYSYEEIARFRSVPVEKIQQRAYRAALIIRRFANPDNYL